MSASWFQRKSSSGQRRGRRDNTARYRGFKPVLETLEDRTALSSTTPLPCPEGVAAVHVAAPDASTDGLAGTVQFAISDTAPAPVDSNADRGAQYLTVAIAAPPASDAANTIVFDTLSVFVAPAGDTAPFQADHVQAG